MTTATTTHGRNKEIQVGRSAFSERPHCRVG